MGKRYFILFLFILTLLTAFRLSYITSINLCFDEAYNWEWSQRLSTNYYSQPGMVAWWIKAFSLFGGNSQFFVRLPAVVATFISGVLLYMLAFSVSGSGLIALLTAITFQLIPVGTIGSILIMHDVVTMPFWILSLFFLWKVVSAGKGVYWYGWAVFLAMAASGKISSLVMLGCLAFLFLMSRESRKWLKIDTRLLHAGMTREKWPHFYLSLILFGGLFSHNIIWNFNHDFVNYKHLFRHASNYMSKPFEGTIEFLGSQMLLISPVVFVLVLVSAGYFVWKYPSSQPSPTRGEDKIIFFILATSVIPLVLFLIHSLRGKVEGNWANIVYPTGFIGMYIYLSRVQWKKSIKVAVVSVALIFAVFISSLILYPSNLKALGVTVKPEDDRFNEVCGWDTLGSDLMIVLKPLPADIFLFGINYQTPAIIRYYTPGHPRVYCLPYEYRKGNQYDIWDDWETLKGKDSLLVIFEPMTEDLKVSLEKAFESGELYKTIPIYTEEYGNTPIRTVNLYLCKKFKGKDFIKKPVWY